MNETLLSADFTAHLERLRSRSQDTYALSNLLPWLTKYTYLDGAPYTLEKHEYQKAIYESTAKTVIVVKCAQVGLSEMMYRYALGACATQEHLTVIVTMPTSGDAEKQNTTRIMPCIASSPELRRLINPELNNSEVKGLGTSFVFFRGTKSTTQALSIPADIVISDEVDKSDPDVLSTYVSRLQHKPTKMRKLFSTPTIEKYGISLEAETAKRFRYISKCEHCNHKFLADYYQHIIVPGWDKPLEEITKRNLHETNWREAYLACPKCKRDPNLHHTRQQFICENNAEDHNSEAYFVSPFAVPEIITPSYMVEASTKFARLSEFKNQVLGITAEESNEQITEADLDRAITRNNLYSSEFHMLGCDIGATCHATVGRMTSDGTIVVVHRERIHYTVLEETVRKLSSQYRVVVSVFDSMPYTDLVTRLCNSNPNTWGAMFVTTNTPGTYTVVKQAEDAKEGKLSLRLVKLNRTPALDALLAVIKEGKLQVQDADDIGEWKAHLMSMKRVQKFDKSESLFYSWEKTDGEDHFHFSLLFLLTAIQLRQTAGSLGAAGLRVPLVSAFKLKR